MRLVILLPVCGLVAACSRAPPAIAPDPPPKTVATIQQPATSAETHAAVIALGNCAARVIPAVDDGTTPAAVIGRTALELCHASYAALIEIASQGRDRASYTPIFVRTLDAPGLFTKIVLSFRTYTRRKTAAQARQT
jgi:hypothetical protein